MDKYIKVEPLLKKMQTRHYNLLRNHGVWDPYAYGFDSAIGMVSAEPAAYVEELRHGEWVLKDGFYECSECEQVCPYDSYRSIWYWTCHYCPNCGAKMDGKGEGE